MSVKLDVDINEATEIVAMLQEAAAMENREFRVLDVGGGDRPLAFATDVIDIIPWDKRAKHGYIPSEAGAGACRFKESDWNCTDVCEGIWKWDANYFDIVWCTDVLTMLRDPIHVVREMNRVGKVGYIRIPNRNYESLYNVDSGYYVGYGMSRWFADVIITANDKPYMLFTYKHPNCSNSNIYEPQPSGEKYTHLWWTGFVGSTEVHYSDNEAFNMLLKSWELEYSDASQ